MTEILICGDCKKVNSCTKAKRGSRSMEVFLWATLFFPGIFYTIWRNAPQKKICKYCESDFLLPADSPHTKDLLGLDSSTNLDNSLSSKNN
jgi:hypothetical protein